MTPFVMEIRGFNGCIMMWRFKTMAVTIQTEIGREQYWVKRLTWHMPFPNTHGLAVHNSDQ